MKYRLFWRGIFVCILVVSFMPVQAATTDTITVNTTGDVYDLTVHCSVANIEHLPGTDELISLREALCVANYHAGADTIEFAIDSGCDSTTKVCTITPTTALPALTQGGTTINGYSQTDAVPASGTSEAAIKIEIDGSSAGSASGLTINSSGNQVQGLNIHSFAQYGIRLNSSSATQNYILGNYIGTDPTGSLDQGNYYSGVMVDNGANDNKLGDDNPAARNLISGNDNCGIRIKDSGTDDNKIIANYIGITSKGDAALGNGWSGICIENGAQSNVIGGDFASSRNIISANGNFGVVIEGAYADPDPITTSLNIVAGNYIGTNAAGDASLGNAWDGVTIRNYAPNNIVGGDTSGSGNLIAGNGRNGVNIYGTGADFNTVSGNLIGTNAAGTAALGNTWAGMSLYNVNNTTIGGDTPQERNVIAANVYQGIDIHGVNTYSNIVIGNYIGTDATGTQSLGNGTEGIRVYDGAYQNTIGGSLTGYGNLISGNLGSGIQIKDADTRENSVQGNIIGADANGDKSLGNSEDGIDINSATQFNVIGGDSPGDRNVISGNAYYGIRIFGTDTMSNTISGNFIGVDITGTSALGNGDGVYLAGGAQYNIIGGDTAPERNLISGNDKGLEISSTDTMSNTVIGNFIGTDITGSLDLGNLAVGVIIGGGAKNNTIGSNNPNEANVISGNNMWGVWVLGSGTSYNTIKGNIIGLSADGTSPLGNSLDGLYFSQSTTDNTVGPNNLIAHNMDSGVAVSGEDVDRITITQNSIYANVYGIIRSSGANNDIPAPTILDVTPNATGGFDVTGTSCAGCTVEIFANSLHDEQGQFYLASNSADGSGNFTVVVTPGHLMQGNYLTATASNTSDGTSMFSGVYTHSWQFIFVPLIMN